MVNYLESNNISQELDDLFIALSSDNRRRMVETLAYRPATVAQLAADNDLSLPAMHKHVRILERANLIVRRKVGRTNFVALNRPAVIIVQNWANQFHPEWGNDQETLENYIASMT